jgi:transcriptional regulator with XRE-family HTH domain
MLAEIRARRGISQNRLSKMSGVPQSVICDIERGKTKAPRIDTMMAIAEALGVKIDELVKKKAG